MEKRKLLIHQVYGLFEDNQPMSDLFRHSYLKCCSLCYLNNNDINSKYIYQYKLWNKDDCDKLVKKYSPQFDYYFHVKYKIMKVDIIRFLILYDQGGIYLDMDVVLNTYNLDYLFDYENEIYSCYYYYFPSQKYNEKKIDIEIISTINPKNNVIKNYLDFIPKRIIEKDNIDWYNDKKIRYVFQTTGPRSFMKYLDFIKYKPKELITILLDQEDNDFNNFNHNKYLITKYYKIDFISYHSLSYYKDIYGNKKVDTKYRNNKKK